MIWDRKGGEEGSNWMQGLKELGFICEPFKPQNPNDTSWLITAAPREDIGTGMYGEILCMDYPQCRVFRGRGDDCVVYLSLIAVLSDSHFESEHGETVAAHEYDPFYSFTYIKDVDILNREYQKLLDSQPDVDQLLELFQFEETPSSAEEVEEHLDDVGLNYFEEEALEWMLRLFRKANLELQ